MNLRKIILLPVATVIVICSFVSCGQDRWPEYAPRIALDSWIYDVMQENYLWYNQMASQEDLNLFLRPAEFLAKAKISTDNYSSVDSIRPIPLPVYGFDYSLVRNPDNDTAYNALITYVIPNSPADVAGLKRGNWIMKVDTSFISKKYEAKWLQGVDMRRLVMGKWTQIEIEPDPGEEEPTEPVYEYKVLPTKDTLDLGVAAIVEDTPIHTYKTLSLKDGSEVGYLMYNSFTAGTNHEPEKYNDMLRAISVELSQKNINRLILDLRYNGGGSMDCAQLLGTLMVPPSFLDQPMVNLKYNDKNTAKDKAITFDQSLLGSGNNLDLTTLVVLFSSQTAGAPEMMIFGVNGKIGKVVGIGNSTKGQNVATERFVHEDFGWAVNPVVCTIVDAENKTYGSFQPTFAVSNASTDYANFLPFGDPKETLLSKAIEYMETGTVVTSKTSKTNGVTAPLKIEKSVKSPASLRFAKGLQIK